MGQKDIAEKTLESYNDVFADIINVLIFEGEDIVRADELSDQPSRITYKADGIYREVERDVIKQWKNGDVWIANIGIENQTAVDESMPFRVFSYDGMGYQLQLRQGKKRCDPVSTLVLYFGYERRWSGPSSLFEVWGDDLPEIWKKLVNDYKITIHEIAFLPEEKIRLFKSDFGIIADYFYQKRVKGFYSPSLQPIKHVKETLSLLSVLAEDQRYEEAYNKSLLDNKEVKNMCETLDYVENRGLTRGQAQILYRFYTSGMSIETISEIVGLETTEIQKLVDMAIDDKSLQ